MKRYKAPHPVVTGGTYYEAGQPFVSDTDKPGAEWEEISDKEAAVLVAATDSIPDDADLEALTKTSLLAVAFMRNVQGLKDLDDADDLRTAIRASYEPAL